MSQTTSYPDFNTVALKVFLRATYFCYFANFPFEKKTSLVRVKIFTNTGYCKNHTGVKSESCKL